MSAQTENNIKDDGNIHRMDARSSLSKTVIGILIYSIIINTFYLLAYDVLLSPEQWLLYPLTLLYSGDGVAWIFFVLSIILGWLVIEQKQ